MKCEFWRHQLALEVEGDLPEDSNPGLVRHLDDCAECRAFRSELVQTQSVFKKLRVATDDEGLADLIRERVVGTIERRNASWTMRARRWAPMGAGIAVCVTVALLTLPPRSGFMRTPTPPPSTAVVVEPEPIQVPAPPESPRVEASPEAALADTPTETVIEGVQPPSRPTMIDPPSQLTGESGMSDQLVVKLLTDDPNLVIYWVVDNQGE